MNSIQIIFPKGAGGSWLASLIWNLQTENWVIPKINTNFDNEPMGSVLRNHYPFTYSVDSTIPNLLLSTNQFFNLYLNHVKKILYPIHHVDSTPDGSRIVLLADKIQPWLTDQDFKNFYCTNIDLEYELIFSNELKFIKRLYEILDQYNISYIKNEKYIRASMTNYRSTCESPEKHLGNIDSFEWLGFCLAVSRVKNITVDQFNLLDTIDNIKPKFYHLQSTALEFVKPYMFEWKQ